MTLCELCKSIPLDGIPPFPRNYWNGRSSWKYIHVFIESQEISQPGTIKQVGLPHYPNLRALRDSANTCHLCNLILTAVDNVVAELNDVTEEKILRYNNRPGRPTFELWLTKRRDGGDGFWVFSSGDASSDFYLVAAVGFCVKEGMIVETGH
jgi:hypothetical protein